MLYEEVYQYRFALLKISYNTGDAEAHGIASLLTKCKTVACIYIIIHIVAKLWNLQRKDIDLAIVYNDNWYYKMTPEVQEDPQSNIYIYIYIY